MAERPDAGLIQARTWPGRSSGSEADRNRLTTSTGGNVPKGRCPCFCAYIAEDSHPVKYPTVFLHANYYFTPKEMPWDHDNPVVLSNGDQSGNTYHGDFFNGVGVGATIMVIWLTSSGSKRLCRPRWTSAERGRVPESIWKNAPRSRSR